MLFQLFNEGSANRMSHCGVLEFIADEGKVYLPYWLMQNLALEEGSLVRVKSATLPVGTYAKFQAQSTDFLDIWNPKAVLENALRSFACLTEGDMIAIDYNNKIYELSVLETKPKSAISIIECDMNVEFEAPVGYVEPTPIRSSVSSLTGSDFSLSQSQEAEFAAAEIAEKKSSFSAFSGSGVRLDGRTKSSKSLLKSLSLEFFNFSSFFFKIFLNSFFLFLTELKVLRRRIHQHLSPLAGYC
eukprot:Sdes_comp19299_c0_seq2m10380